MQEAYFVDQQDVGDWTAIGYEEPTSKTFDYSEGTHQWDASAQFDLPSGCTNGWYIAATKTADKKLKIQGSDNCATLTPNFKNIGTSS